MDNGAERDAEAMSLLLGCPNKAAVNDLFLLAFSTRLDEPTPAQLSTAAELLGSASASQSTAALAAVRRTILRCAYDSASDAAGVVKQLAAGSSEQMARLVAQIVVHHMPTWREELIECQVAGPRLLDLDWRVDIQTASDSLARMAVPTCLVQLQVQDAAKRRGELPGVTTATFEMNKEALNTMLDGLSKIKAQLSDVAQ